MMSDSTPRLERESIAIGRRGLLTPPELATDPISQEAKMGGMGASLAPSKTAN